MRHCLPLKNTLMTNVADVRPPEETADQRDFCESAPSLFEGFAAVRTGDVHGILATGLELVTSGRHTGCKTSAE